MLEFMLFYQLIWHAICAKGSPILAGLGAYVRFDIVKVYARHHLCVLVRAIKCIAKNSIAIAVINKRTIRRLKRSLLAGLNGRVA
jgi:hypothetical protein